MSAAKEIEGPEVHYQPKDFEGLYADLAARDFEGLQVSHAAMRQRSVFEHGSRHGCRQRGPCGLSLWILGLIVASLTAILVGGAVGSGLGVALAHCPVDGAPTTTITGIKAMTLTSHLAPAISATVVLLSDTNTDVSSITTSDAPTATDVLSITTSDVPTATDASSIITSDAPAATDASSTSPISTLYQPFAAAQVNNLTMDCTSGKETHTNNGYMYRYYCGTNNYPNWDSGEETGPVRDIAPIIAYSADDCAHACAQMNQMAGLGVGVECRSVVFTSAMAYFVGELGANCWLKNATKGRGYKWKYDEPNFVYIEVAKA